MNAFPPSSHWLEGPLLPPPEVWHREEEVRVGGVEVNLHTSDWPGQQAQAIRPWLAALVSKAKIWSLPLNTSHLTFCLIMVLEIFFAGNSKENSKSLKPVYVPETNKAWINKYRGSFLLKLLRTIHLTLWSLFHLSGYYPLITIGIYMCCNRVLPPTLQYNKYVTRSKFRTGDPRLTYRGVLNHD